MGLRRSGKSSIQKVVFHKMSPSETLFLESTNKICREDVSSSSFVSFQIWDFPGQIDFFDPTFDYEMIFRGTGALIFVIDSQVRSQAASESIFNALSKHLVSVESTCRGSSGQVTSEGSDVPTYLQLLCLCVLVGRLHGGCQQAASHRHPSLQSKHKHQL